MTALTQNSDQDFKCTACGSDLPADARFCEQCGQAVSLKSPLSQTTPLQSESLISHFPVKVEAGKGFFGGIKYTDYEILITNQRLLFLYRESGEERWLQEQDNLDFDTLMLNEEFAQWRSMLEQYDFSNPLWDDFYLTPFEELLVVNKHNFAVEINDLLSVTIELDNELDALKLSCADGTQHHCKFYMLMGNVAYLTLAQVLDSSKLKLVRNQF